MPPGRYVTLGVSDTGVGIAAEHLPRVFEPFFTTKELGKGTGLGLSSVHGFVTQSGGHVRVTSEVGSGTSIRLYFPEAEGAPAPAPALPAPELVALARSAATVLLVEDDPGVRMLACEMVEEFGYRVVSALDGPSALALAAAHPEIELLFTDVMLPNGMNGRQVAEDLRRGRPGLPVVFASGYPRDVIEERGEIESGWRLPASPIRSRTWPRRSGRRSRNAARAERELSPARRRGSGRGFPAAPGTGNPRLRISASMPASLPRKAR